MIAYLSPLWRGLEALGVVFGVACAVVIVVALWRAKDADE